MPEMSFCHGLPSVKGILLVSCRPMAFLGGSLRVTKSISSQKMIEGKSHGGSGSWRQARAPMRRHLWRVRRAVLHPKRRAVSFGYDLKSYSQNFDDSLVPAHRL
ncbi:hypothetical protein CFC21_013571 [Triticum aestivum]|uniref:Uncharacterized protein n=2 Tax=Triticum aestivum TaxID=4565 RepID=A0A9R1DSD7_WHEAT|nr:hypothetical protein CFC21_013571 [Triticum aestivum]